MRNTRRRKDKTSFVRLSKARLDELVEEAIVDCYNESEQVTGLYTMIEDNLVVPFETAVLRVPPHDPDSTIFLTMNGRSSGRAS